MAAAGLATGCPTTAANPNPVVSEPTFLWQTHTDNQSMWETLANKLDLVQKAWGHWGGCSPSDFAVSLAPFSCASTVSPAPLLCERSLTHTFRCLNQHCLTDTFPCVTKQMQTATQLQGNKIFLNPQISWWQHGECDIAKSAVLLKVSKQFMTISFFAASTRAITVCHKDEHRCAWGILVIVVHC